MKQYRVRFSLPNHIAQKYDAIKDKPTMAAKAIEWYLSYGEESIILLRRVETMMASWVPIEKAPKIEKIKHNEIDDVFRKFVI